MTFDYLQVAKDRIAREAAETEAKRIKYESEMQEFKQSKWFTELDMELHRIRVFNKNGFIVDDERQHNPSLDPPPIQE